MLRERVTSKGGTTYAAITSMQADGVDAAIRRAVLAAQGAQPSWARSSAESGAQTSVVCGSR